MPLVDPEDFEAAARKLRIRLDIDDQLRPDMISVITKMKHLGLIKDFRLVPDQEMVDDEAYFDSEARLLSLRETTFYAASAAYQNTYNQIERRRARYTIAHEIAHIALGHKGRRYRGRQSSLSTGTIGRQERDAERFAAAFLAPQHLAGI